MTITPLHLQTITLFGDYGTAKTSVALGNPKALYYDLEDGKPDAYKDAKPFTDADGKPVARTWAAYTSRLKEIWEGDTSLDGHTLVIDTVTDLWRLCEKHHLAKMGVTEMPRDDFGRSLKAVREDFELYFNLLLMLRTKGRMGTVFIAHEEVEEVETDVRTIRTARPKVTDKHVKGLIGAKPQMVLKTLVVDEHPITLKPFSEPTFLVVAKRLTAQDLVKDRTGRLPKFTKATWAALEAAYNKESKESDSNNGK